MKHWIKATVCEIITFECSRGAKIGYDELLDLICDKALSTNVKPNVIEPLAKEVIIDMFAQRHIYSVQGMIHYLRRSLPPPITRSRAQVVLEEYW